MPDITMSDSTVPSATTRKSKPFTIGVMYTRTIADSLLYDDVTGRKCTNGKTRDEQGEDDEDEEWTEEQTRAYKDLERAVYEFLARETDEKLDRLVEATDGESRAYQKGARMSKL